MALLEKPIVNQGSVMMNNYKPCVSKLKMALLFLCEKHLVHAICRDCISRPI